MSKSEILRIVLSTLILSLDPGFIHDEYEMLSLFKLVCFTKMFKIEHLVVSPCTRGATSREISEIIFGDLRKFSRDATSASNYYVVFLMSCIHHMCT